MMQYLVDIQPNSLFVVNAISLFAFAVAFFCIWLKQRDRIYWLYWTSANFVLSAALVIFVIVDRSQIMQMAFANSLLVLGLALRWQALRLFFYRRNYVEFNLVFLFLVIIPYLFSGHIKHGVIFGAVNVILFAEIILILRELLKPNDEVLPSRWGLVFAYGLVGCAFVFRIVQSWIVSRNEMTPLPLDSLLTLQLLIVSVHIVASGAFAISIAYERGLAELKRLALRDPLTELYNRRAFELALAAHKPDKASVTLILLDIDHFKRVNDEFGHEAGDIALKRCANILTSIFRKKDVVARIGGEEFAVILPETTMCEAYDYAERARQTIENDAFEHAGRIVRLTISAGVCQTMAGVTTMSDIAKKADVSLYMAKNKGRNRVEIFAA